jgi:hypothetical protein
LKNNVKVEGDTAIIEVISKGELYEVLIDTEDLERLPDRKIGLTSNGYVRFTFKMKEKSLHRFLLGEPDAIVDHIDGNPLNNKKNNLRAGTHTDNMQNQPKSKYYTYCKQNKRYLVRYTRNGKTIHVGSYETEREAQEQADKVRKELYGK